MNFIVIRAAKLGKAKFRLTPKILFQAHSLNMSSAFHPYALYTSRKNKSRIRASTSFSPFASGTSAAQTEAATQ